MKLLPPALMICVLSCAALAQTFAVADIQPSDPTKPGYGTRITPGRFTASSYTLRLLIIYAYDLHRNQVLGGPSWLDSDKFNIVAKPDGNETPTPAQWKIMVQKLLADRFQLTFHHQKKTLSVYALTIAKGGPKLKPVEADPADAFGDINFRALGKLEARHARMSDFTHSLQKNVLDRPIVDQTGLSGRYDFTLDWLPDEFQFSEVRGQIPANTDGADLITAIQQQLGLKLTAAKASADVIVIDRAKKPSAN